MKISEMMGAKAEQNDLFSCDTVRVELSSLTYDCKFENGEEETLIETNRYIFGKTVDTFTGDDYEIVWDIDINTGIIKGWDSGKVQINFKVTDGGRYSLLKNGKIVAEKSDYVPFFLQIDENGYNDYVEITVDKNGQIKNWDGKYRKIQVVGYFQDNEKPINKIKREYKKFHGMNEGLEPRSNGRDWSKIYSEIDVLKYVCENLPNKIKVAVAKFSNLQKNNQYSPYNEYVGINGVSYDSEGYWLNLEDDSRYSLGLVMQDLKKGKNLNEIFTLD